MKNLGKTALITVLGGACAVALLAAHILRPRPQPPAQIYSPPADSTAEISDARLTRAISDAIGEGVPLSNPLIHITAQGTAELSADASRDKLLELIAQHAAPIPPSVKFILKLLPEAVPVTARFGIGIDSTTAQLSLTPQEVTLGGISLSGAQLPDTVTGWVMRAVNGALTQNAHKILSLEPFDGKILVTLRKN